MVRVRRIRHPRSRSKFAASTIWVRWVCYIIPENYEDALFEAGCDDALIAVVNGQMFLDFHRDGLSFEDAVKSASRDVEVAGGKVIRVVPTPE
jgi:hypothetical protein